MEEKEREGGQGRGACYEMKKVELKEALRRWTGKAIEMGENKKVLDVKWRKIGEEMQ